MRRVTFKDFRSKPKTCNAAIRRSCKRQSNAFERLVRTAAHTLLLSRDSFIFLVIAKRQCWALCIFGHINDYYIWSYKSRSWILDKLGQNGNWSIACSLTCSSGCFTVCYTSVIGEFLVFEVRGDSCLEGLSIATSKSTQDSLLLTVLVLTSVSRSWIIGEESFLLFSSVSVEPSLNDAALVRNFSFRVGAAKLSFITSLLFGVLVVLVTCFSDVLQLFIEVVDKLFEPSSVFWL